MLVLVIAVATFASLSSYSSRLREGLYIGLNVLRTLIQIFLDRCVQKRPNLDAAFFNNILGRKYLLVSNSHSHSISAELVKCTLQIHSSSRSVVDQYLLIYTLTQVMMHTYVTLEPQATTSWKFEEIRRRKIVRLRMWVQVVLELLERLWR